MHVHKYACMQRLFIRQSKPTKENSMNNLGYEFGRIANLDAVLREDMEYDYESLEPNAPGLLINSDPVLSDPQSKMTLRKYTRTVDVK